MTSSEARESLVGQVVDDHAAVGDRREVDLRDREALARAGAREHRAPGVDDLGRAEEAQRAPAAGLVRRHHEELVLDRAGHVAEVEVARLAVVADAPRRVLAVDRPGRQGAHDLGAVERQRARRLREELVVAEQHPEPPGRGVEGGEAAARDVGEALGGRQVDLALVAEHAVAVDADRRRVQALGRQLAVARADHEIAGERDQARDLGPVRRQPGRDVGRHLLRPGLADVAAERRLRQHEEPRALLARADGVVLHAHESPPDVAVEGGGEGGDGGHGRSIGFAQPQVDGQPAQSSRQEIWPPGQKDPAIISPLARAFLANGPPRARPT